MYKTWYPLWERPYETIGTYRTRQDAEEAALECTAYLSVPFVVSQGPFDRLLRRYRVITMKVWLRNGFRW